MPDYFVRIKTFSLLYNTYAYFDTKEYTIDNILNDKKYIYVQFLDKEYWNPDYPEFAVCFIKCFKWDAHRLENEIFPALDKALQDKYGEVYSSNNPLTKLFK